MDSNKRFLRTLSPEEEQLIIIRDFLYEGDWEELVADLKARQEGKPFVFKLNTRIEEDLQRIEKLEAYERVHGVDLGERLPRRQDLAKPADPPASGEAVELDRSGDSGVKVRGQGEGPVS